MSSRRAKEDHGGTTFKGGSSTSCTGGSTGSSGMLHSAATTKLKTKSTSYEDGSSRSSSKKSSPLLPSDSDIERMEEKLRARFNVSGEITTASYSLISALSKKLEHSADELESCQHQAKLLKSSNERLIRENEQLLRATEKKDKQIRELQAQLDRLLADSEADERDRSLDESDATVTTRLKQENEMLKKERDRLLAAATARKTAASDDDRKLYSSVSSVSLSGRHDDSDEMQKLRLLQDHVDTLSREKEFLERQLRTNKGEAGRKLEEFAESVNASIKTIVSERELLTKKNKEYADRLEEVENENRQLKKQVKKLQEDCESLEKANADHKTSPSSSHSPPAAASSPPSTSVRDRELIQDLENNIRFLTAELEHSSLLMAEKDKTIKQLQQRAPQQSFYPEATDSRQSTNNDLIAQLHESKREKQRLEMELIDARTNLRKVEEERNRLNSLLSDRTHRFDDYHETKTALGVLEQRYQVLSDTLATRERELDRARKLIEDLTAKENRLQRSCNDLTYQVSSLSQQLTNTTQESEDATNRIRQLLADSNFFQKKFQKKEAKLAYTLQVLNAKEKELQDMLASNRRLNDLTTMLKTDLDEAKDENASLNQAVADLRHKLQHVETSLRAEQQRAKRYEELFDMERRKAEESRDVREHLQRHIAKWESMKEELGLLQRGKELQDAELHRLRKDNEALRNEKDRLTERMRELAQASESARSTVELQDMTIARLDEEKASLKDYVLKYEAELSKHEAQVAQLTAELHQLGEYCDFLERTNKRMEELVARMNDNAADRDRLLQEFDRLQRSKKGRASAPRTPHSTSSSPVYHHSWDS